MCHPVTLTIWIEVIMLLRNIWVDRYAQTLIIYKWPLNMTNPGFGNTIWPFHLLCLFGKKRNPMGHRRHSHSLKNLTFQILRMAAVVELEHLGKPPEDAIFCLLCRGTIALPDVNYLFRENPKMITDIKISTTVKLKLFPCCPHNKQQGIAERCEKCWYIWNIFLWS